ncbi:MAG TPA: YigZ family protein [Bacillota bacterium]|nr:YigZ family protein [Bacillota bacterium]
MLNEYYTVQKEGSDEIIIQKSRFIGHIRRVETEEEAQSFIQEIKKKHHDATHNCSAYTIGEHDHIQKANDDGEPSRTAGIPILEVLLKKNLKDTVAVVTRYFGGIKLGAGGLIRAYSTATSQAIQKTGIVKRMLMQGMSIAVGYPLLGKIKNMLETSDYILDSIQYLEDVTFTVFVPKGEETAFKEWMTNVTSDQATITTTKTAYVEQEVHR